ncbi:peptidoglycan-binding protein [Streptomyces sp. NPDC051907]|uniref:peptidoglycan-binding protein n=1 Tax=Streptomyces sp. NPDC051907 TaxID=3155284 RepID=UPI0034234511
MAASQWRTLVDHIQRVPEGLYDTNGPDEDINNRSQFERDGEPWCVMFNWDMYADVGLEHLVPKVSDASVAVDWARTRDQWSQYPSVGAWTSLSRNGRTSVVVGFDETHVYTKGGDVSPQDAQGSAGADQGYGVFSRSPDRHGPDILGYFAPVFENGCPPTADPDDPRGGAPVESWRWPGPVLPRGDVSVKASEVVFGARNTSVRIVQGALATEVGLDYASAPGTFGPRTQGAVAAFQRKLGLTGSDADGVFGRFSLTELGRRQNFAVRGLGFFDGRPPTGGTAGSHVAIPLSSVKFDRVEDGSTTAAAKEACRVLGVPEKHWVPGIMVAAGRESSYRFNAVNSWDSNATGPRQSDGHPRNCSRGLMQVIPPTFSSYHQPGTSEGIYDGVANICASMNYVMVRYGVYRDGTNLAGRVCQFDPNRGPCGY